MACPRSFCGHAFPLGRLWLHTQPDAAPFSSACHGIPKSLLLVFPLIAKNIVSMYLQNHNIPYVFPKTYGLGYSQTLRKGGQRRRVWVKTCRLSLGLTTAGGEEGLAQFLCCFSQAPAGQPVPWGDSLMSRREWGSGSATSGCPSSKAWQVT